MRVGFALNNVLSANGQQVVFDVAGADRAQLQAAQAQVARFELRLDPLPAWNDAVTALYAQVVDKLTGAGIMVIGLLSHQIVPNANQAAWNSPAGPDGTNPFTHDFITAVQWIVPRLPKITHWEIWNEPNSTTTFIDHSLYAALLKRAYDALKATQPQSTVITGGTFAFDQIPGSVVLSRANSGSDYLNSVISALIQQGSFTPPPFDAIGLHLYLDQNGDVDAAHLQGYINTYYAVLSAALGRNVPRPMPIFVTEAGWQSTAVTPAGQASNIRTLLQVCRANAFVPQNGSATDAVAPYIDSVCYFDLRDGQVGSFGIYYGSGYAKPAVAVFQERT